MQTYTCPSCAAEIIFQTSITLTCVCAYCNSLVVRHETTLESLGTMAQLPEDISPFQLGTSGVYHELPFKIIGRLKMAWESGYWNEWFIYMDDHKKAWLIEAQGSLAIVFEKWLIEKEARADFGIPPTLKSQVRIAGINYTVCDIKESHCVGSEGELPFVATQGRKVKSFDLIAGDNVAGIEYVDNEPPAVFTGKYVEFDALSFSYLRTLAGWNSPYPTLDHVKHWLST